MSAISKRSRIYFIEGTVRSFYAILQKCRMGKLLFVIYANAQADTPMKMQHLMKSILRLVVNFNSKFDALYLISVVQCAILLFKSTLKILDKLI